MTHATDPTAHRLIPVVVLDDAALARPLAEQLLADGIGVAEVTLRTPAALDSIRAMAEVDGLLVGAGTVLSADQVDQAVDAGAQFVVSPGLHRGVVERAAERGVVVVPGAVTPTEVMTALEWGITTLKFFPASTYGGPAALRALSAVFGTVRWVPTGGIGPHNVDEYLALPSVVAVGGSWMVTTALERLSEAGR
ncbi:bifunctional 4-hydroxy-2-oxoglutarate aldolase/2-dehydro-3-deoxy-phosphogluconate aldolase [Aestuariimicrobium ganziense]|uniref:bifunctional 4-hydroxy-2-oxoglutarate aldolase/2-dehydro-3-deoxy-phosphogluconate aldolase n=1 Tax=Aestuariimicrobium ganziense TaxID=2773677 RepID=UPI001941328F|nr:bifunctional 4-hydroxy-2-oxoglutarate aldolase/2-dehydro-3-deoxy-phosphogluconate aldolase [Aestuariimicrobium ganziense]